jgi:thiamine monophosphate kinase
MCLGMESNIEHNEKSQESIHIIGNQQPRMKCIRCPECGEEILMVPTLGKMIELIENHVSSHRRQPNTDVTVTRLKTPSIRTDLTKQVLQQASDMMDVRHKPSPWL